MRFQVLAKLNGVIWRDVKIFKDLQEKLNLTLEDCLGLAKKCLHPEPYTKKEVCDILGVTPDELNDSSLSEKTYNRKTLELRFFNYESIQTSIFFS